VVVSHRTPEYRYELLNLNFEGELSRTGDYVEMGRPTFNEITFTPDGELGFAVHDDGTLGVFRISGSLFEVVDDKFVGDFYASEVVMGDTGNYAYVLDAEWRDIGGGIYRIGIGCDGEITDEGLVAPAKLPHFMAQLPGTRRFLVAAHDFAESPLAQDTHLVELGTTPVAVASTKAFASGDSIIGSAALSPTGDHFFIGDNNAFGGNNRIGAVWIEGDTLTPVGEQEVEDPYDLVASPFGNALLVVSGFGEGFFVASYNPSAPDAPLGPLTEIDYLGDDKPAIPARAVLIDRGVRKGLVLVAENVGVRRLRFDPQGNVEDLGLFALGSGTAAVTFSIGVQP
jgi:hypothetical protein